MSKIKNSGFDQYGAEPFEQQQFATAGVEGVNCKCSQSCMYTTKDDYLLLAVILARDAFARTKLIIAHCHDVHLFVRLSVRLSVWDAGTGVHCDHTVHVSADLSLWLDSPMFWACTLTPKHVHLFPAVFPVPPGKEVGYNNTIFKRNAISQERSKIAVTLLFGANRKSYMPRRLAKQQMTSDDLVSLTAQYRRIRIVL